MPYELPDQEERDRVVNARANVFIPAGAGTGKTHTLVSRILELAAPESKDHDSIDIEHIAAITFTRRGAGELKSRIRSRCLKELANEDSQRNSTDLLRILEHMDRACIGTIHSFADRLLRKRPVESGLSPDYDVVEDEGELYRETFDRLMAGVRRNRLAEELPEEKTVENLDEVKRTLTALIRGEVPEETPEGKKFSSNSLEKLIKNLIDSRGTPLINVPDRDPVPEMKKSMEQVIDEIQKIDENSMEFRGIGFLKFEVSETLKQVLEMEDRFEIFETLNSLWAKKPLSGSGRYGSLKSGADYNRDDRARGIISSLTGDPLGNEHSPNNPSYRDAIIEPIRRWLASKLDGVREVAISIYEKCKREEGVVDQMDLLLKLRELLCENPQIRNEFKDEFQHILVDEFQDTDPLQAEIIYFLSEAKEADSTEKDWENVCLGENMLTLVGDPKQSIFRFRRADIQTFSRAIRHLLNDTQNPPAETGLLKTNFRSGRNLIEVYNRAFSDYMGEAADPDDPLAYDEETGGVSYQEVTAHPACAEEEEDISGEIVLFSYDAEEKNKGFMLKKEGTLVADYIYWLVNESDKQVRTPESSIESPEYRPIQLSDIAILGRKTTHFKKYLDAFAKRGIACSVAGGSTFLDDEDIKQFVLALRAISDPADGAAEAALERSPFFSVDYDDLIADQYEHRLADWKPEEERLERAEGMRQIISELRSKRFHRPPVQTAIDLIESTALARYWSTHPEGFVKMTGFYHVAARVDTISRTRGLDFDGVTEVLRNWVDDQPNINPPSPVDEDAVNLQTLYQAKGLEYPIVFLFHGASKSEHTNYAAYSRDPYRERGFVDVKNFEVDLNQTGEEAWSERDETLALAENKRLFYVAATRARDTLVVPNPQNSSKDCVYRNEIFDDIDEMDGVRKVDANPEEENETSEWSYCENRENSKDLTSESSEELQKQHEDQLSSLRRTTERLRDETSRFLSVSEYLRETYREEMDEEWEQGRHGPEFGSSVHDALEQLLISEDPNEKDKSDLYARMAEQHDLPDHQKQDLKADVQNALEVIQKELSLGQTDKIHPEYPITFRHEGNYLTGVLDLLVEEHNRMTIIDFKTGPAVETWEELQETYPHYQKQIELYREALQKQVSSADIRVGLLFTQNGNVLIE